MVTTKLNLSMTEPQVRQIYAKQGDTGRVLDIALDQTPEDGTLRILRPDGTEVTSEAVTGGEVSGSTFESLTEADVTELTVGIEPVQDLNGYDKPWVGGAGKNKLGVNWREALTSKGITFTPVFDSNGSLLYITGTGTSTGRAQYINNVAVFPSAGTYTLSQTTPVSNSCTSFLGYTEDGTSKYLDIGDATGNTQRTGTIGTVSVMTYVVEVRNAGVTINDFRWYPQLELGSSATAYEPYSNICPITGHDEVTVTRTGKNLVDTSTVTISGITFTQDNEGKLSASPNNSDPRQWGYANSQYKVTLPKGSYTLVVEVVTATSSTSSALNVISNDGSVLVNQRPFGTVGIKTASFALTEETSIGVMVKQYSAVYRMMIVASGESTSYEPYQGSTYTTSLGQTVYGGTLDMVSGVLTVTHYYATISGNDLNLAQNIQKELNMWRLTLASPYGQNKTSYQSCISNKYVSQDSYNAVNSTNGSIGLNRPIGDQIIIRDDSLTTRQEVIEAFNNVPLTLVTELAEPVEYQLTPQQIKTLVGTNNVWASSGDIVNITFTYGGLLSELPSEATEIVGKCYCDVEQNGVSSMPFTLNVKKNERQ